MNPVYERGRKNEKNLNMIDTYHNKEENNIDEPQYE